MRAIHLAALAIAATGGAFEAADSTRPGEWIVVRRFELRAIRPARRAPDTPLRLPP